MICKKKWIHEFCDPLFVRHSWLLNCWKYCTCNIYCLWDEAVKIYSKIELNLSFCISFICLQLLLWSMKNEKVYFSPTGFKNFFFNHSWVMKSSDWYKPAFLLPKGWFYSRLTVRGFVAYYSTKAVNTHKHKLFFFF